jgi:predicted nucleotidyltransferase
MNINEYLSKLRQICRENGIKMLGVFGSVARGEDTPESDVDLLIKLGKPIGIFEFIALEDKFVEVLGRKVDLGTEDSLHPKIRRNVLRELKVLYQAE